MSEKITPARLLALLKDAGNEWLEDKAMKMSAALAYYTTISIAPLIIITMKIVGLLFRHHDTGKLLSEQVASLTGPQIASLTDAINSVKQPGTGVVATVISIVVALFGASGVFGELQDSLNTIWEVRPKPNRGIMGIIQDRFLSITMVLGIAFLLLVSMFVSTTIATLSQGSIHLLFGGSGQFSKDVLLVINVVLSVVVITLLFAAIFRYLPDVQISWGDVWLGAFVTSVLFEIGKAALTIYFKEGAPTSAYGAAGSLVAALLWICYSAYILFFGAEFTQVYANAYGSRIVPAPNAEPLTEEMRARAGIPHDAPADRSAHPGVHYAPSTKARTAAPRASALPRTSAAPRAANAPRRRARPAAPPPQPRPSYVARYLPVLAAVVLARFAYGQVRRIRQQHQPAAKSAWREALLRWTPKLATAAAPLASKAFTAAKLWKTVRKAATRAAHWYA